ncbi:MAG TPA: PAS domain-containing protein, partial [Xanthomonadaceae bacterium]|nr:PAS domain-containing protein [Xanthomonadaceae bacterium]
MFQTHISTVETHAVAYPGLELLATAVVLLADELGICYANPAAENLFELSRRQLVGHSAGSVFGEAPALFQAIDKALASGASYTEQELELGVAGKLKLHLSCTVSVVETPGATL